METTNVVSYEEVKVSTNPWVLGLGQEADGQAETLLDLDVSVRRRAERAES